MSGNAPSHKVYAIEGEGEEAFWTRIGSAWPHKDGKGFNITLSALPCNGRVQLQSRSNPKAFDAAKKKRTTYASGKVNVGTGMKKTVKLKLTKQGKKLLRRKKKLKVWANMTFGKGAQKVISTQRTKVKR